METGMMEPGLGLPPN